MTPLSVLHAAQPTEAGVAAFRCGFEDWVSRPEPHDLAAVIRESLRDLRTATEA